VRNEDSVIRSWGNLMREKLIVFHLVAVVGALVAPRGAVAEAPELGIVHWERSFDRAIEQATRDDKPVFALFQEVPGCSTCVGFGKTVLSNPLLVDAIENEFVPLAIFNNRGGEDGQVLRRYGEPGWNNPVVRFLDGTGQDLIPRRDGLFAAGQIGWRMIEALKAARRPVPKYLEIAVAEAGAQFSDRATFAMSCYWSGEACLGSIDGILASRTGWLKGREVVEIQFHPGRIDYATLLQRASANRCADQVFAHDRRQLETAQRIFGERATLVEQSASEAKSSDQKYHLGHSALRDLDLTPLQAARVNAALADGSDPTSWLSPRQHRELRADR
jgi:hypothetical protein